MEETVSDEYIVVGFSQLGAESDWRSANTESMKSAFTTENGYKLIFEDGQQKQTNQITAIRTFIQQEVDYIVLAPVTETGWDTVLQEAKDAGIPVIIVDRIVCWVVRHDGRACGTCGKYVFHVRRALRLCARPL